MNDIYFVPKSQLITQNWFHNKKGEKVIKNHHMDKYIFQLIIYSLDC